MTTKNTTSEWENPHELDAKSASGNRLCQRERLPKNKSGMSLISDIDLMLADDDERTEALKKIKAKYKL